MITDRLVDALAMLCHDCIIHFLATTVDAQAGIQRLQSG